MVSLGIYTITISNNNFVSQNYKITINRRNIALTRKRLLHLHLIFLIFLLTITGCTASRRPTPPNNTTPGQNVEDNNNLAEPNMDNNTTTDNNRANSNIMPDVPQPTTPNSTAGFNLDEINEFDLEVRLTNNDKIDMEYNKDTTQEKSKVETQINGKVEKTADTEAIREIERLLTQIPGGSISETNRIIDDTLAVLNIKREDVKEFEMEFKFKGGEMIEIKLDKSHNK